MDKETDPTPRDLSRFSEDDRFDLATLDFLHVYFGLGSEWMRSDIRAELLKKSDRKGVSE